MLRWLILIDRGFNHKYLNNLMNIHIIMFSENNFSNNKLVTIAKRIHLFPSRTQKLSSLTAKIVFSENSKLPIFFIYFFLKKYFKKFEKRYCIIIFLVVYFYSCWFRTYQMSKNDKFKKMLKKLLTWFVIFDILVLLSKKSRNDLWKLSKMSIQ